jgi:microcystin degradation protein MlrC
MVGGIFHEGHSFSRLPTTLDNFEIVRGADLLSKARGSASSLGGAVRALEDAGVDVIPSLSAVAPPGGAIVDSVYEELKQELLEFAANTTPDALVFDLHGAILTESLLDPEGDLLEAMRALVGNECPIAVAMDLHANPTPAMLRNATMCLACKENPHTDYADAGARVANMIVDLVTGKSERLTTAAVWLPLVIGAEMETVNGPLRELHQQRREELASNPGIADISIYNTTAYLDAECAGQCITVAAGDKSLASRVAKSLAQSLWAMRDRFAPNRPSVRGVLEKILAKSPVDKPYVLGDQGDRVLAGAPGDSTEILSLLKTQFPGLRAAVPVTDAEAVERAQSAGINGTLTLPIGGRYSVGLKPSSANWTVIYLGDGRFIQKGPYLAGEPANLGPTAVLKSGRLTVLVTSLPGMTQDPAAFESNGIRCAEQDVIVAKSGFHFKLSFNEVGHCVVVDTAGLTNYRPGLFVYRHRGPIYPDDKTVSPSFEVHFF